jgi:hypothetical protein
VRKYYTYVGTIIMLLLAIKVIIESFVKLWSHIIKK